MQHPGTRCLCSILSTVGAAMFRSFVISLVPVFSMLPWMPPFLIVHGAASLLGSALVIAAALQGNTRGYINIAMAVVIIALGLAMGYASKSGKKVPRLILLTHAGLAVGCYGLLGLFALAPQLILI